MIQDIPPLRRLADSCLAVRLPESGSTMPDASRLLCRVPLSSPRWVEPLLKTKFPAKNRAGSRV
jgi:hypothetical protein